ncbi:hypothetical protein [Reyranella soli]|uniref:hypothetical protein n=1 Tax=Reyranella soli TaxID=1230389 RepID=UPI0011BED276|nr:hypothetical protein [Reyranella soli]
MKPAAACLLVSLALAGASAMAQAAGDPMDRLRACSTLADAERVKCLDRLSREIVPESARPRTSSGSAAAATQDSWIVSETTSPIDYSAVVIASATAGGAPDGSGLKLSIACRGGNTSVVLSGSGILPPGDVYTVSYAVDGGSPTTLAAAAAASGTGMAIAGDAVRLLLSLPTQGEISFRIAGRQGATLEGRYSLDGMRTVRERMAIPCRWQVKPDTPRK